MGSPIGFIYTSTSSAQPTESIYIYTKNAQGDITGFLDSYGNQVVTYTYDAWGNVTDVSGILTSLGYTNGLRYRGYYYDNETGRYYLQSRYYDPFLGRFLNSDTTETLSLSQTYLILNLFTYCYNNPLNFIDSNGKWPEWLIKRLAGDSWNFLKPAERKLVCKYPYKAKSINYAKEQTEKWGYKLYGEEFFKDNNEANAFRHAFWSAAATYLVGETYAKLFTDAHEDGENDKSSKMDLKNNKVGIKLGKWYSSLRSVWTTKDKNKTKNPKKYFTYKSKKINFTYDPYDNIATIISRAAKKGELTWLK